MPTPNDPITVSTQTELNNAIQHLDATTVAGNYTIGLTGNITEGVSGQPAGIDAIQLAPGVDLTITGQNLANPNQNYAIDGGGTNGGFAVIGGNVTIQSLTLEDTVAQGGNGDGSGGGGAGMGGGLFVGPTATVTLEDVSFSGDVAKGGNGGAGGGGGGGGASSIIVPPLGAIGGAGTDGYGGASTFGAAGGPGGTGSTGGAGGLGQAGGNGGKGGDGGDGSSATDVRYSNAYPGGIGGNGGRGGTGGIGGVGGDGGDGGKGGDGGGGGIGYQTDSPHTNVKDVGYATWSNHTVTAYPGGQPATAGSGGDGQVGGAGGFAAGGGAGGDGGDGGVGGAGGGAPSGGYQQTAGTYSFTLYYTTNGGRHVIGPTSASTTVVQPAAALPGVAGATGAAGGSGATGGAGSYYGGGGGGGGNGGEGGDGGAGGDGAAGAGGLKAYAVAYPSTVARTFPAPANGGDGGAGGDGGIGGNGSNGGTGGFGGGGGGGGHGGDGGQGGQGGQGGTGGVSHLEIIYPLTGHNPNYTDVLATQTGAQGQAGADGATGTQGYDGYGQVGGFGAGAGANGSQGGAGGGALGAGGDIFVAQGGSLILDGGLLTGGSVAGGHAGGSGAGDGGKAGSGIFLQGDQTAITLAATAGDPLTISDQITDQSGSGGTGAYAGKESLVIAGTGTVDLATKNTFEGGITIKSGTLVLGAPGAAGAGAISFGEGDPPALDFVIADAPTNTITDFGFGDTIDVTDLIATAKTGTAGGNGVLAIPYAGGTLDLNFGEAAAGSVFRFASDGVSGTDVTLACFLAGTRLVTEHGDVAVETLRVGDGLVTLSGAVRPIRWIGYRRLDLARHPTPSDVCPVRIVAGALGIGMPSRNLLVSPDHAMLVNGHLLPARLLLNGATVARDDRMRHVTYFHVELDTHDILLAEGAPAESYLDTGNRAAFENAGSQLQLHPNFVGDRRRCSTKACMPLTTAPDDVEPIWRALTTRAQAMGWVLPDPVDTENEPDLHLIAGGRRINPAVVSNDRYVFAVPSCDRAIRLVSRAASPSDQRPWLDDRRRLGVQVCRLTFRRGHDVADIPMDHPMLIEGWWATEHDNRGIFRWTDGDAALGPTQFGLLEVQLAGCMSYPLEGTVEVSRERASH